MATFTMRLKDVLGAHHNFDNAYNNAARAGLGIYPLFDESYRPVLNRKIIDHYFNWEIGTETVEMFQLAVRRRMNEIMPYYNQLYASERIKIDPLKTVDIKNISNSESTAENVSSATDKTDSTSDSKTTSKSRNVNSEFPQNMLQGDQDYATNAADAVSETDAEGSSTGTTASDRTDKGTNQGRVDSSTVGTQGSQAALLMAYRETFLNIDLMIIKELEDCFMQVWNTNDDYTGRQGWRGYYGNQLWI